MKPALVSFLILIASTLPLQARPLQPVAGRPLVLTQVSIIDATGVPLQPGMTVVNRDGHIVSVGKTGRVRIPRGAQIVVAQGKFLVPWLVGYSCPPRYRIDAATAIAKCYIERRTLFQRRSKRGSGEWAFT
jgi:hypothetical protein